MGEVNKNYRGSLYKDIVGVGIEIQRAHFVEHPTYSQKAENSNT
jgi:hypothetical protein